MHYKFAGYVPPPTYSQGTNLQVAKGHERNTVQLQKEEGIISKFEYFFFQNMHDANI